MRIAIDHSQCRMPEHLPYLFITRAAGNQADS